MCQTFAELRCKPFLLSTLSCRLWRAAHELISTLLYQKANSAASPSGRVEGAANWVEKSGL